MRAPAYQMYAAEWLADEQVTLLSIAAEGVYIRLLNFCWREGSIPSNPTNLAPLCKYADVKVIKEALALFTKSKEHPGRLIHKRLEGEREKQQAFKDKQVINGKLGGRPRKANDNPDESQTKGMGYSGETQTEPKKRSSSSSSTSSSTEKEQQASSAGAADFASQVDSPEPESPAPAQRPTPGRPKSFRYDNAPVFIATEFFNYLRTQGYGHVDMGMYLVRITDKIKNILADPQQRKLDQEATNDQWKAYVLRWLDRDKANQRLLLPDDAPRPGGYHAGPNPALQVTTTSTSYSREAIAARNVTKY